MNKEELHILNLRELKTQKSLSAFLETVHYFSQLLASFKSEQDIFDSLVNEIPPMLDLVDCVIYKVDEENQELIQVAAYGQKNEGGEIKNKLKLKFGQGFAGLAASTGESQLIKDVTKSDKYVKDLIEAGSEIEIPIKMNDEVYAVISSEHPEKNFYNEFHVKLFEVLASIAVGALIKIRENEELEQIKVKLEDILEQKSGDLDRAIDAISSQYSELKYNHEKRETLIQEVHHRVNNNLQIISSILKMYLNRSDNGSNELQEIHNRVQAMALIHQNIYKSIEMNLVDVASYIRDLMNYLKSLSSKSYISFEEEVSFPHISLNTLVPLGLFITELVQFWSSRISEKTQLHFTIILGESKSRFTYELVIMDSLEKPLFSQSSFKNEDDLSVILIEALVEQLEGEIEIVYDAFNKVCLRFNPVD